MNAVSQARELISAAQENVPEELLIDVEETTDVVEPEAETVEPVEAVEADVPEVEEQADDAVEAYNVATFAEATGLEVDDIYQIEVPMDSGEPVKLGELKNQLRDSQLSEKAASDKIAAMESQLQDAQSGVVAGQQVSDEVRQAEAEREAIVMQYQQVNWEELEKSNPGEAALHRQKFQQAFNSAEGRITEANNKQAQARQAGLQEAYKEMHRLIPEWNDKAVMDTEHEKIRTAMRGAGYQDDLINSVSDPRALMIWRELVMLREEKSAAAGAISKVRKAPKVLKGRGKFAPDAKADQKKLRTEVDNASPTGRRKAEMNLARSILGVK